jgi:hypothetical protein
LIATTAADQASAAALAVISTYEGALPVPTLNDYANVGVTGVSISNLAIINSAIAPLTADATDSAAEIQSIVDAYSAVIAAADGLANGGGTVTQEQFQTLGLNGIDTDATSLLNSAIDALPLTAVDTQPELVALGDTVAGIITTAKGGEADPALTPETLAALGMTGVTASNLAYVLEAYATAGVEGLTNMTDLQAITTAAAAAALAAGLDVISAYDGTNTEPTIADFANAEVTGVTSVNLAAVNSVLAIVSASDSDTTVEIQAIVDAMQKVIAGADGTINGSALLTASDFESLSISSIDTATKVDLMNQLIDRSTFDKVDTYAELSSLADVIAAIVATSAGSTPSVALSVASFEAIGITGINETNLAFMLAAIEATPDDTSGVNTLAKIQAIATQVVADQNAALTVIRQYDGTNTEPLLSTFAVLGVTGVDAANIAGINDYLEFMGESLTDTPEKIQSLVDAYIILALGCDGLDNDNVNLTLAQWHALGYVDVQTDEEVQALNDRFDTEDWLVTGSSTATRSIVEEILAPIPAGPPAPPAPRSVFDSGGSPDSPIGINPDPSMETDPIADSVSEPVAKPVVQPSVKPAVKPAVKPGVRPAANQSAGNQLVPVTNRPARVSPVTPSLPLYEQAPTPGFGIRTVKPGQTAAVIEGKAVQAVMKSVTAKEVVLAVGEVIELSLKTRSPSFRAQSWRPNAPELQVMRTATVVINASGFAPNTLVDITMFSDPVKLGEARTDSQGRLSAVVVVSRAVPAGPHTIKFDGVAATGELLTVSIGVQVLDQRVHDRDQAAGALIASGDVQATDSTVKGMLSGWAVFILLALVALGTAMIWFVIRVRRNQRLST